MFFPSLNWSILIITLVLIIIGYYMIKSKRRRSKNSYAKLNKTERKFFEAVCKGNLNEVKELFSRHKINPNI